MTITLVQEGRFRTLYATAADLQTANPLLLEGEWGTEKVTFKQKIGDGVTYWNDLPYIPSVNTLPGLLGTAAFTDASDYATTAQGIDSREWAASTVTQPEAEAGVGTTRRAWTAERVFQAIAAWWTASSAATKLGGIAIGATANATDAQLRDRSTHTGTQPANTVIGLNAVATSGAYADLSGRPPLGTSAALDVGVANGIAPLDSTGKLAPVFLPSYVDDVVEVANFAALPPVGELGKIYVTTSPAPGLIYRWSGSVYTEISPSPGSTDAVPEGIANLYHTAARVIALVTWGNLSSIPSWITNAVAFGQSLLAAADEEAARTLLGLGSAATQASSAFVASSHVGAGGAQHSDAVPAGASGFLSGTDKSKLDALSTVATSGAYADLSGRPALGDLTFIQSTAPTGGQLGGATRYSWWDTSGGNLTLWIEDGT